jgi:hypothetical protein
MEQAAETRWGLLTRRPSWRPTLLGWICILACAAAAAFILLRALAPFLRMTERLPTRVLVVEGWLAEQVSADGVKGEIDRGAYETIYLTGGPYGRTDLIPEAHNYPELMRLVLERKGIDPRRLILVPCADTPRDRTYASAVALREWLSAHGRTVPALNLYTLGAHARRSRLLFEKALGDGVAVGVIAGDDGRYDPSHWWRTSAGVRTTIDETIAYLYARLIFRPDES